MGEYVIKGGNRLSGEVKISGAKNAVLPMLAAAVLMDECIIHNVPDISDVRHSIKILCELGSAVSREDSTIVIDNTHIKNVRLNEKIVKSMRSSVIFAGALLGKFGRAELAYPGGCELGARPVDMHISSFVKLGIQPVIKKDEMIFYTDGIKGCSIKLRFASVGATENIMLAAVTAKGTTIISNAAKEPEIVDLAGFLNSAGADIDGAGTDTMVIKGVKSLKKCEYRVMSDRIETGTFLCAAASTGGELFLKNGVYSHISSVAEVLQRGGCIIRPYSDGVYIDAPNIPWGAGCIDTAPYPGIPTDMQPQLTAVMCKSRGETNVYEAVFEGRYRHIYELEKMGADIEMIDERHFKIKGVERLVGTCVQARDLRGGAALIVAALGAEGTTTVEKSIYVERGYEHIEEKLRAVGADIVLI